MLAKVNKKEIKKIIRNFNKLVPWSTMLLTVETYMTQYSNKKIESSIRDMISTDCYTDFTTSGHTDYEFANNLPMVINETLHYMFICLATGIGILELLLTISYGLPSICLKSSIHARWDLDSETYPVIPCVYYSHSV